MKKTIVVCGLMLLFISGCGPKKEIETENTTKEVTISSSTVGSTTKETKYSTKEKESSSTKESSKENTKGNEALNDSLFVPNPEDDDEEVSYESSGDGNISAFVPDYSQYTKAEVISKLGEPSQIITDTAVISERLEGGEWELIKAQFDEGKLTENQAKAFMFQTKDLSLAASFSMELELLVYEDQNKPNVYLSEDSVQFITPMTDYIHFNGKIETL
ncbi:DUF4947 domain-containing protein [Enterococcus wangshanyuanii]|uniref:DUF5067 domain-containing protein n=1 Tax=Enterococcus wangshanyuanii TaxID=2005703 RepID=A0ABQ1PKK2_9ENTE|nr:DUF4947 domain-containing protein [Enterococcus wangshanyuanii]GGC98743.1 hypothetical protein GCM10011573_30350 [Enterococcus wangshanyuanii]